MKKLFLKLFVPAAFIVVLAGCQKMTRPALGNYPGDKTVTPATALRFYVPFDSFSTAASQLNIRFMDSISGYPCFFPDKSVTAIAGARGTGFNASSSYFLTYYNSNDFVATAQSFTVAFWEKRNGKPDGDAQFAFSIPSDNGYWAGASMFVLFDHQGAGATDDSAVIKMDVVDKNVNDNWFEWSGSTRVKGIQNNAWHHIAFVYDATTSTMTLYVDGVKNPATRTWGTHGGANMDAAKATGFKLGGRPKEDLGWGKNWRGGLDQFRLYNAALSATDIAALYNGRQ